MNKLLEQLNEELERLEKENESLKKRLDYSNSTIDSFYDLVKSFNEFKNHTTVVSIYHHKKRKNTTIKFADGSSSTVRLKKGDKDCLETAIAWALAKHLYNIDKIAKDCKEVGE